MNHESDFDRDQDREDRLTVEPLKNILKETYELETELMRRYIITSERVHDNEDLKIKLRNFAEGNAKRTRQLLEELDKLH